MPWFYKEADELSNREVDELALRLLDEARSRVSRSPHRVLLLPPDLTRAHSGAGRITETLYRALSPACDVHVIPTLGQHVPHTPQENRWMFGSIPGEHIHAHDWLHGVTPLGTIPKALVEETTNGAADWEIPVDLNSTLLAGGWDLIVNVGHVVPHEVLGFANHNKNYFIGLGGKRTICASHMAAAVYGIENNLGCLVTPLRACYNWAEERLLGHLPDVYFEVVMRRNADGRLVTSGVYAGDDQETYLMAARASGRQNITTFPEPVHKIVAVMQADEFRSTWVANKAIYRTRLAIEDGGELLIIAPGLERFGEQEVVDRLIRKYGYAGRERTLCSFKKSAGLRAYAHAAAHLIHGSPDGRFTIRYAPGKLTQAETESVGFGYADLRETLARYSPDRMREGWNTMPDGERVFFISTPSAGLWATGAKVEGRLRLAGAGNLDAAN
jgi:nickel-dependent lactate racemase